MDRLFRTGLVKRSNEEPIPEDEPIFILRARDCLAFPTLQHYQQLSATDGCNAYHMDGIDRALISFMQWSNANPEKLKQPGITKGR